MNKYELMIILDHRKSEEKLASLCDSIEKIISSTDGVDISKDVIGLRDLAYTIRKESKGYYVLFKFQSNGLKNREIESKLNINEDVFRYMIIKDESEKVFTKMKVKDSIRAAKKKERETRQSYHTRNRDQDSQAPNAQVPREPKELKGVEHESPKKSQEAKKEIESKDLGISNPKPQVTTTHTDVKESVKIKKEKVESKEESTKEKKVAKKPASNKDTKKDVKEKGETKAKVAKVKKTEEKK